MCMTGCVCGPWFVITLCAKCGCDVSVMQQTYRGGECWYVVCDELQPQRTEAMYWAVLLIPAMLKIKSHSLVQTKSWDFVVFYCIKPEIPYYGSGSTAGKLTLFSTDFTNNNPLSYFLSNFKLPIFRLNGALWTVLVLSDMLFLFNPWRECVNVIPVKETHSKL